LPGATASDNCSATANLTVNSFTSSLAGTQCSGTIERTYFIADECGNVAIVTQIITVTDDTDPVVTCPADVLVNCHESTLPVSTGFATATDNCTTAPGISSVDDLIPGNCPGNYAIARIWTATDDCGNTHTCVQTITVQDVTPPSIACPTNTIIDCDDPQVPSNTGEPFATDLCDPAPVVAFLDNPVPGNCLGNYVIERTWTATDNCGNTAACVQTIGVQDITAPVITCPPTALVNCENTTPAAAGSATATDNCDASPVITHSDVSTQTNIGACTDQTYTITRTWLAVDACGNSALCVQTIAVQDTTRPTILCPLNITINCEVATTPANTGTAIATDNCDTSPGLTPLDIDITPMGACPNEKVIRRRWVAVDNCANINACEQIIRVQDTTKPVLTLPANVTLDCHADLSPAGQAGTATATDNCTTSPTVTHSDNTTPGTCLHSYTIFRTWTSADACGNSTSGIQVILVRDVTAPVIQCPADQTIECNASLAPNVNTALGKAIAIDNCDPMPIVAFIDAATQVGPCIRDTIVTRTWSALDNCNNASACQQTITKKDTQGPVVSCPANATVECDADTSATALGFATALDNCGTASVPMRSDAITAGNCPQEYTIARTWTSLDDCGNVGTCVQTITVDDSTPPVIACPAGVTVQCDDSTDPMATGSATSTDNCDMSPVIDYSDVSTQATVESCPFYTYTITRTWSATDACGNSTTCVQILEVVDTEAPTITCPADATINCEDGIAAIPSMTGTPTTSDNCDPAPPFILQTVNGVPDMDCPQMITFTLTWYTEDYCGNSATCQQTVVAQDTTRPVITCPAGVTIECDDSMMPAFTGTATATDNCDAAPVITSSDATVGGGCPQEYALIRTWTATDACDNVAECTQTITVFDDTAPVLTCPPNATVNCDNVTPAAAGQATASDNCDASPTINFSDSSAPGNCPDARTITRTWTGFDACGNQAIPCTQTIVVQDTTKPVIICPLNVTINCEVAAIPANTGTAIASDNCDASVSITHIDTPVAGDCPQERVISRRWIAVDNCFNAIACIQTIAVQDTTRPALTCPANVILECSDDLSPAGQAGVPTVLDNCDAAPAVNFADVSTKTNNGTCSDFTYTITRTWTATDACGNVNTCVQTIEVVDTTPPVIACPPTTTIECDEPLPGAIAIDNCDPNANVIIVTTDETPGGCPQEKTILRTWVAIDACGNVAPCSQTIVVVDDTAPVVTCPDNLSVDCTDDTMPAFTGTATATDNCGTATAPTSSDDIAAGNCPQEYVITRTWTSVDDCGNIGTCVQTISVDDSTPPAIVCPANVTIQCDEDFTPPATGEATASDNCGPVASIVHDDAVTDGNCPQEGTIARTWTATDACGNATNCVQTIEVIDNVPPTFDPGGMLAVTLTTEFGAACPAVAGTSLTVGQIIAFDEGWTVAGLPIQSLAGFISDNCAAENEIIIQVASISVNDDLLPCRRTITISFQFSDPCGNLTPMLFTCVYEIVDNTAPTFTVPTDVTLSCEQDLDDLGLVGDVADVFENCTPGWTATYTDNVDGLTGCNGTGTIVRTWRLTDDCGNSSEQTQAIVLVDITAPVLLTCPPTNVTVECGQDESPMATGFPTASDNCDPGVSYDYDDVVETTGLQCPLKRRITRIWTVTDDCGNSITGVCTQTILVTDNTAPLIVCPADITINCDDPTHPDSLNMFAVAIDACDLIPTIVWDDEGSTAPCSNDTLSAIVRTWFAFDVCGNVAVCDQVIALIDDVAPVITCPQDTVINCEVPTTFANTGFATATDNCDANPLIETINEFVTPDPDCPQAYTLERTFAAFDLCSNSSTCVQTITVQDTTRPLIVCPANVTIECDESTAPANTGVALALDNCDQSPVVTHTNLPATPLGGCSFNREFVRVWLAGDACDNGALCQQRITILDSEGPVVTCPASVTIECTADTSAVALGFATASDNCGTATTPVRSDAVTLGNCPQEYAIARTWTSVDDCGNVGTCVQTISVDDSTPPTFTEPADITIYADANCGYDAGTGATGDVTNEADNCASGLDAVFSDVIADGQCAGHKIITRAWSLNDGCGNVTTHDQIITVLDTLNPIFPKPDDVTLTTDAGATCPTNADISLVIDQSNPVATANTAFTFTVHGITQDGPTVYSDNCSFGDSLKLFVWNIQEDFDGNADSCYRLIRVLWRVYDDCGNFQQRQQRFTILENKAPEITFCPPSLTVNCEDSTLPAATGEATASDNCDPMPVVIYSDVDDPGACPQEKTIARTWTATDNCGNSTQCSQTITVVDDEAPVLACPPNATVNCDDVTPVAAGMATATDNCDAAPTIDFSDQSTQTNLGLCSDQSYSITRTWTAYDACGNQTTPCVQTILVRDVTAPVITCPADATVSCEESLNPQVNTSLGTADSDDNCDPNPGLTFTDFAMPGNCANERTILRTWLTVDNCNNPAACTQTIHVVDDTAPTLVCPKDTVVNCEINPTVNVTGMATATDLCDANPTITHSDATVPGACPNLRIISRTWMAVDACGNSTVCVQTITVQDTTRPLIVCPNDITVQCNEGIDTTVTGVPVLTDNCDAMLAANYIDNPLPPNGCTQIILRNWLTADDCNNAAACAQVITVTDSQPPTLAGVPDVTVQCDEVPPLGSPTVSDNCDPNPTMSYLGEDIVDGQCPDSYVILRSWALGDNCGNSTVFVQTITVQDTEAPVWTNVPADVTVECDDIPGVANPTATDVCDNDVTIAYGGETRADGECGDLYTLTRTWTATDNCFNSTVLTQTITVQDTTAPTWESALPADITVECGQVPQPETLIAEDNCDDNVEVEFGETSAEGTCPVRLILTRTWVAYDNCSNSTVHTQTITVTDTTPPVADCVDITVELDQNGTATVGDDVVDGGSSDNCGAVQYALSQTAFDCDDLGSFTVQLTVTDGCGLTASCSATVTVDENIPPVWTTQPNELDRTVECGDAAGLAAAQSLAPVATDNCDDDLVPVKTEGNFSPSTNCPPVGTYTNSWTVTDASGNTSTVFTQIITIADTTKPVLTCPANLTLECDDEEKALAITTWLASATATDACAGALSVGNDYDGDSIPPLACDLSQGLTVHFSVSDNCGNSAACSASIHVLDTEGPTINGDCDLISQYGNNINAAVYIVGTSIGAECPEEADVNLVAGQEISHDYEITVGGVVVPGILGCLSDNCTAPENLIARVVSVVKEGDACIAEFEIRMVVLDACGNQSADTIRYLIEVADNTAPTFTAPADVTVYVDDNCSADLSGTGNVTDENDNCQVNLEAVPSDVIVSIQGSSTEYVIERTWTLTDGCGNSTIQVQYITVLDTIKPDFGCPSSVEVAPNSAGCTYVVDGNHLDPDDPTDNCGTIVISYDLSGATDSTGTGSLDGMAFNEGTTTVVWTVSDGNGNSVTCSFTVVVTQCIQISGTLIWEGDDSDMTGVAQAMVALSGDGTDTDGPTMPDGKYTLISGSGGNFVVTPTKTSPPADPLNGVSVLDALLVQQYIVGLHTFPDGYKMIAADVNMSNAITTLDASIIRQAILGSSGAMAYFLNKPWRFVPTKDDTPYSLGYDPGSNPFASPIPSTRVLSTVTADAIGEDFYGIKTGDVNATGNPQNKPENLVPLRLRMQDRTLESGQNIYVPVRMGAYDQLAGFQVAFDFDTDVLELISVEPISSPLGLSPASHFGLYKAAEGEIRSAWIDPYGQTIVEEIPVFALRFAVKQSGAKLSEVFGMKPKAISPEAYNMDHEVAGIELQFYEEQTTSTFDPLISDVPGMTLQQNRPNPFTDRTVIGFSLDQGCDAQLRILDASGRELYRIDNYYPAGKHEEVIYLRDLRATGVLYYQLHTPYGTLTRKMTALAP